MSSDEAKTAFIMEPHHYVRTGAPIDIPPLRLSIIGVQGAGKVWIGILSHFGVSLTLLLLDVVDRSV